MGVCGVGVQLNIKLQSSFVTHTVYHRGCVETWLKDYKHTCPLCKDPITAQRKKRTAAKKSERTPLLAATDGNISVSYNAVHDDGKDAEKGDCGNAQVAIAVQESVDVEDSASGALH